MSLIFVLVKVNNVFNYVNHLPEPNVVGEKP